MVKMTKASAERYFNKYLMEDVRRYEKQMNQGRKVFIRKTKWADYVQTLFSNRSITEHQFDTWGWPATCQY